jgi:hypothetical protein
MEIGKKGRNRRGGGEGGQNGMAIILAQSDRMR